MARKKTPAQIERQYSRLTLANYRNGDSLSRSQRITRAAQNVRAANGYSSTGSRTRNMDTIFRRNNGSTFTVQGDRTVAYRGKKISAARGAVAG